MAVRGVATITIEGSTGWSMESNTCETCIAQALSIASWQNSKYIITPHAQRERGKVIDRGVHIYTVYLWSKKKFESYFRDRLTFSNVDSRTSR